MPRSRTWTCQQGPSGLGLACTLAAALAAAACKTGPDLSTDYGQTARENYELAIGEFEDRDWDETVAR